jgi:hypothetical protein
VFPDWLRDMNVLIRGGVTADTPWWVCARHHKDSTSGMSDEVQFRRADSA